MYYNFVVNLSSNVCNVKLYGGFQHLWSHCFDFFSPQSCCFGSTHHSHQHRFHRGRQLISAEATVC